MVFFFFSSKEEDGHGTHSGGLSKKVPPPDRIPVLGVTTIPYLARKKQDGNGNLARNKKQDVNGNILYYKKEFSQFQWCFAS